jgi:LPS sulfotransferase NodH
VAKSSEEIKRALLSNLKEAPSGVETKKVVAIISTPRCGSTYLCEVLKNTGKFGMPEEWINPRMLYEYMRLFGLKEINFQEYIEFLKAKTTTPNGVFSINFHIDQYISLRKNNVEMLRLEPDHTFYLYREDKLAQAISFAKAKITDQWNSHQRAKAPATLDQLSCANIYRSLAKLADMEDFYRANIQHLVTCEYSYEQICQGEKSFREILDLCQIEHEAEDISKRALSIQRDELNAQVMAKVKTHLGWS